MPADVGVGVGVLTVVVRAVVVLIVVVRAVVVGAGATVVAPPPPLDGTAVGAPGTTVGTVLG